MFVTVAVHISQWRGGWHLVVSERPVGGRRGLRRVGCAVSITHWETTGADVLVANHTSFDRAPEKLEALKRRQPGDPHPYVIGNEAVRRYVKVAEKGCARAELAAQGARWKRQGHAVLRRQMPYEPAEMDFAYRGGCRYLGMCLATCS